jgi:cytochrome c-type biogenesis protein CcmH/NrfG
VDNRLLLAQTYNELGMQDKSLAEMRKLQKENPENHRINLILGSILSGSAEVEKLKESLILLDKASGDKTIQQYLVHMYKGDALIRMQDHEGALEQWKLALKDMPPADNRRTRLEQRVSELSARENKKEESQASKS